MVETHLRAERPPKLFLAKVMALGSEIRGKGGRRVLRTKLKLVLPGHIFKPGEGAKHSFQN